MLKIVGDMDQRNMLMVLYLLVASQSVHTVSKATIIFPNFLKMVMLENACIQFQSGQRTVLDVVCSACHQKLHGYVLKCNSNAVECRYLTILH